MDPPLEVEKSDPARWTHARLQQFEIELADGSPTALGRAEEILKDTETRFEAAVPDENHATRIALSTARGHLKRLQGHSAAADEAYRLGLRQLGEVDLPPADHARRAGGLWTYRGLLALAGDSTQSWRRAVAFFDKAIELRRSAVEFDFQARWASAAAWINRGEALAKLGGFEELRQAVEANVQAEILLSQFDLDEKTGYRTRFALTHKNRGELLAQIIDSFGVGDIDTAIEHFRIAAEIVRPAAARGVAEACRVLAATLTNLGRTRLLLKHCGSEQAEREAREALALALDSGIQGEEGVALELTARIGLCRILASPHEEKNAAEITDLAEEGIRRTLDSLDTDSLISPRLDTLLGQLFLCGADAYRRHLPDFLADYLLDFLDPERGADLLASSAACQEAAVKSLWQAIADLRRDGFQNFDSKAHERRIRLESEWSRTREVLAKIRSSRFTIQQG